MTDIVLQGRAISKSFGVRRARHQVLFDVDIQVRAGECLAVIGGSGSGKTTLTRILLGLDAADSGTVSYRGDGMVPSRRCPAFQALRRQSGLVFQNPFSSLDPRWTVARSVSEPLMLRHRGMPRDEMARRTAEALEMVELDPAVFMRRYPIDLSGGQAQRVAIARAIVDEPKVLLADEALSAVDMAARMRILAAFAAIRKANPDMALIMVSHDLAVVRHLADRVLVLHDGRVEESGSTADVLAHPRSQYAQRLIEAASMSVGAHHAGGASSMSGDVV